MEYGIGIDMGGTRIKVVVMQKNGVIKQHCIWTTDDNTQNSSAASVPIWARKIRAGTDAIVERLQAPPRWIGIATPGLADKHNKRIEIMPGRLNGLEKFDWENHLAPDCSTFVLNDAHAALCGEVSLGAAKGKQNVVMLTLGTGVGGAIMIDGKLIQGRLGRAGHIGHLSVDYTGEPDICGTPGSIEDLFGDHSIVKRSNGLVSSTKELVELYRQGDSRAEGYWLESIRAVAATIASVINLLDPEAVILGGGITEAGRSLLDPLNGFLDSFEWRPDGNRVPIITANLKDYAGAIGAAAFARNMVQNL